MKKDNQRLMVLFTIFILAALSYALYVGVFSRGASGPPKYKVNKVGKNGCCKICKKGVACGNACIPRASPCRLRPGCACNYREEIEE